VRIRVHGLELTIDVVQWAGRRLVADRGPDRDADAPISKQVEQVLTAIAKGEVAPDVGKKIIKAVQALGNVRAIEDLEQRIIMLEAKAI
jgi:hypothetical protein